MLKIIIVHSYLTVWFKYTDTTDSLSDISQTLREVPFVHFHHLFVVDIGFIQLKLFLKNHSVKRCHTFVLKCEEGKLALN